jgi:hypothetical protein
MRALFALVLVGAACAPDLPSSYACMSSSQCVYRGAQGTCEPSGFCSFPDAACAGAQRRYGDFASAQLANTCVGAVASGQVMRVGFSVQPQGLDPASVSVDAPASLAAGDFLVAAVAVHDSMAQVGPAPGWTAQASLSGGFTSNVTGAWFTRLAGANEPQSYTFSVSSSGSMQSSAVVLAYRGVSATQPIDASASQPLQMHSYAAPSITTTRPGDMLVALFVSDDGASGNGWVSATGLSLIVQTGDIGAFDGVKLDAGPTGPIVAQKMFGTFGGGAVDLLALSPQ